MSTRDGQHSADLLGLRRSLRQRIVPLLVLLVAVTALTPPLVYFVLSVRGVRGRGAEYAAQLSRHMSHDATKQPFLWRYDSLKMLTHIQSYQTHSDVERVLVLDAEGVPIDAPNETEELLHAQGLVWESAPITIGGEQIGEVWVGMSARKKAHEARLLMLPCLLLGLLLAILLGRISLRTAGRAERHICELVDNIQRSQRELAALNQDLERQVEARVAELSTTLDELEQKEEHLRTLSSRAVVFQESERRAIGRDLHDSVGQVLTAVRIHLQLIEEQCADEGIGKLAAVAREVTDSALEEVRRAVVRLGPAVLDEIGLVAAIERLTLDVAETTGLDARFSSDGEPLELPAAVEVACYRIIQEALTNVVRHARAKVATVELSTGQQAVVIRVTDDGAGFDEEDVTARSMGIKGMRERAELLGGSLRVDDSPDGGTCIGAVIPLERSWEDLRH